MDGVLIIDKPRGWTSHDVINFIRRTFAIKKAGHAGTLDPMATGVLVVLLGGYTKYSDRLMAGEKEYQAVLTLGECTDTQDATGKVIKESSVPEFNKKDIEVVFAKFTGETEQVPPMVSALKVGGRTLYKLARQGKEIQRQPRKIFIEKIELKTFDKKNISFSVVCRKGTYVRTLCEDIAKHLNCCGHMSYLRRIRSGDFSIDQALAVEKLKSVTAGDLEQWVKKQ